MKKIFIFLFAFFASCSAQAQAISLISDEETELFLARIVKPLYQAAGISFNRNNIYIVSDNSLNAFVGDGNNLFINTGTILKAKHEDELTGVIAHETGHIMGGHILRLKLKGQQLQEINLASLIVAGVAAVVSGRPDVGLAVALGSQTSLMNSMMAYQVEEERSADESAVKLLAKTKQSPQGLLDFMKKIANRNTLSGIQETSYFRTHPMTTERISFMSSAVQKSPYKREADEKEFFMVQAKLYGFLYEPEKTFAKYPLSNTSDPARYARSVAYFKKMKTNMAFDELDEVIKNNPSNPFLYELKGQMYWETGKIGEAKVQYKKALALLPESPLLQQSLAQVMLEDDISATEAQNVINMLNKSLIKRQSAFGYLMLSKAYGAKGDDAFATYAAAEYSFRIGAIDTARKQINAAKKLSNSPSLSLKIDDLDERVKEVEKTMWQGRR